MAVAVRHSVRLGLRFRRRRLIPSGIRRASVKWTSKSARTAALACRECTKCASDWRSGIGSRVPACGCGMNSRLKQESDELLTEAVERYEQTQEKQHPSRADSSQFILAQPADLAIRAARRCSACKRSSLSLSSGTRPPIISFLGWGNFCAETQNPANRSRTGTR